jgi:large subunit ribosomal protein L17
MENRIIARKLGRNRSHRRATLANLSTELILHKRLTTTEAKAKEMKRVFDKLITKAKKGTLHSQREIFKFIKNKEAVKTLFSDVISKTADRNGGYTRVIKLPPRLGDAANMALLELVDYSEMTTDQPAKKQDRSRRVRGSKKALQEKKAPEKEEATPEELPEVESKGDDTPTAEAPAEETQLQETQAPETETPEVEDKPADEAKDTEKKDD